LYCDVREVQQEDTQQDPPKRAAGDHVRAF